MKKTLALALISSFAAFSAHAADVIGVSSAVFKNPLATNTTYSGVNTNSFTWGNPGNFGVGANNLTFTGASFDAPLNTAFKLGTLSYFNGTTSLGSNPTSVDFKSRLSFSQPGIPDVLSTFTFALNSTPNSNDPVASADFVTLNSLTSPSRFVINGITYTININGFRNVIGDGFLNSNPGQFHVREGRRASAELFGTVTAVPEPETYAMMLAGLGMLGFLARRKNAKKAA
jgi:PEP-CTERM motif